MIFIFCLGPHAAQYCYYHKIIRSAYMGRDCIEQTRQCVDEQRTKEDRLEPILNRRERRGKTQRSLEVFLFFLCVILSATTIYSGS